MTSCLRIKQNTFKQIYMYIGIMDELITSTEKEIKYYFVCWFKACPGKQIYVT